MDGDLSTGNMELETWDCDECVLVDDAGWHDSGVCYFISYELDIDQVRNKGALATRIKRTIIN